jgi:uncharacterized damage-inducible protein DinB
MTNDDRASLIEQLRDSRDALLAAIADLSEEDASRKPASGWSVLDCVEHCAGAERGMLRMISESRAMAAAAGEDRTAQEASILVQGVNRERKLEAPEAARPTGRYATLAAAASKFTEARERTIAYVEQCQDDMRGRMVQHPVGGLISARECLLVMMQHPRRHAAQIREIRNGI